MKKLLLIILVSIPYLLFSQSMNIIWEDNEGRVRIKYNTSDYYGPKGSVSQVGNVRIKYNTSDYYGPKGSVSQVGGLKIIYNTSDYYGPKGSIKETRGSVFR